MKNPGIRPKNKSEALLSEYIFNSSFLPSEISIRNNIIHHLTGYIKLTKKKLDLMNVCFLSKRTFCSRNKKHYANCTDLR